MEVYDSRERSKQGLTPKVTHTNIVSIKRTPFIIRKHHMDDTGMRDVFSQDHAPYGSPRIYQYEGELARLVRTPIKDNKRDSDRHSAKKEKEFVGSETERYVFEEKHLESGVQTPRPDSRSRSKADEIQKIAKVTRRLKEEADRYRDMVKDRVEQDILREGSGVLNELERDIRNLKIRNMQKEKDELERSLRRQAKPPKANDFDEYQGHERKTHTKVVVQKQRGRFKWWTDVLQRKPRFHTQTAHSLLSSYDDVKMLLEAVNKHSDKMDKIIRYRKAFYEKQNDLRNGNRRRELQKVCEKLPLPSTPLSCSSSSLQYCNIYADSLLATPLVSHSPHFLQSHAIDGPLRARMLDWMVEVVHSYKFSHKTYFASAHLMDSYFQSQTERLPVSKLHIVGSEALLIASKMEEVYPLKIKVVHEKIVHKKISIKELVDMEAKMMKQLNYRLGTWTFFDMALLKLTSGLIDLSQNAFKDLQDICSYLSKFILYDYELYCEFKPAIFAEVLVKMSMEIQKLACPETLMNKTWEVEECKARVIRAGKCFGVTHKGLTNTLKYTPKTVISRVNQYFATE